jgi:hypothetical protein
MLSLEQEIKIYFQQSGISFSDNCTSFKKLDFSFGDRQSKRQFHVDAKEKRQRYNMYNWPDIEIPEQYLFVLDDLAARKILAYAPNSGLVVRDNPHRSYFLFTVVDLYLMPKQRVNRKISKTVETYKGKWLIDLRNGHLCRQLTDVFSSIDHYLDDRQDIFQNILACYGQYVGENVGVGGVVREPKHWQIDVEETR